MKLKTFIILTIYYLFTIHVGAQNSITELKSPDGNICIKFNILNKNGEITEFGQIFYSIYFENKNIIENSALKLELKDQIPLGSFVKIVNTHYEQKKDKYKLHIGKTKYIDEHFNQLIIELKENTHIARKLIIEVRAYNDAIAFRYVIPEQPALKEFKLTNEVTEFRICADAIAYALVLPNYNSMYESEYLKLSLSAFSNQGGVPSNILIGLPLLMEIPGLTWIALAEADVYDYSSMYLTNPSGSWTGHWLVSKLAPIMETPDLCVDGKLPHKSSWRIIMIGKNPGKFIESNIITNLSPESKISDVSWIEAGKSAWDWWSGSLNQAGQSSYSTETMKYYVDLAAESQFKYMLIDAGWSMENDITKMNGTVNIPEVIQYATKKNVKIWIWLHYKDVIRQMEEAFALYNKWGIAGVKIDFIERDDQIGNNFYYKVAETAAKYKLMVDFHGCTKPSGLSRTYPNVLGYEAVLGMEQSKAGSRDDPELHTILPFTRMLVGPMDYTPGGFNNVSREEFCARMINPMVRGTRAHHLALYVLYEAPFQMVSDHPNAYKNEPSFEFIKIVPTIWDETKFINGLPGEFVTIARSKGNVWYLGSITNWTPRVIEIPLDFLGDGEFIAKIFKDDIDSDKYPKKIIIETKKVNNKQKLKVNLASAGGCAVYFEPLK